MLKIEIEIDNAEFESAIAKSITLSPNDDLSEVITDMFLTQLKERANIGLEREAEEQIRETVENSTRQKKEEFDSISATKEIKGK